jgi:hypothetical protein
MITLETLLDEMVSVEESARYPDIPYQCLQVSSYDRSSISPDTPGWFANNDGFGIERTDTINGRIEKVIFDEPGPGVITRIWITTIDKRGTWRFYFDGQPEAGFIIPAYDLMKSGIPELGRGLLQPHTSYTPEGKGGNTLFLPIPYGKNCKITFEDAPGIEPTPKYYSINYRQYPKGTAVETFSERVVKRAAQKIAETDNLLLNPAVNKPTTPVEAHKQLSAGDSLMMQLPKGSQAIYKLKIQTDTDKEYYTEIMRNLILQASFDGKQTVWVPLSDFSGAGIGGFPVNSWFLASDGAGAISVRWLMPYRQSAEINLINAGEIEADVKISAYVAPLEWDNRMQYFHASWKQERSIPLHHDPADDANCIDWNFATLHGKGVYKGDVLTLYNHSSAWYGEGDEKIWIDNDTFPSHFGTGTEDYYNSSWAPVIPFHTPFGGAPRADLESSHGYNTFFRTRNLDGIPFNKRLRFDIEMLGWVKGTVDYATTIYWYGDRNAVALSTSGLEEATRKLLSPAEEPTYKISDAIEFEDIASTAQSPSIRTEVQKTYGFTGGKWSGAAQLTCNEGKPGDYIEFSFDIFGNRAYRIELFATKAIDYGIISFTLNGKKTPVRIDGYNTTVLPTGAISLGSCWPIDGKIRLRIEIEDTNVLTTGQRYMFGLDCIKII